MADQDDESGTGAFVRGMGSGATSVVRDAAKGAAMLNRKIVGGQGGAARPVASDLGSSIGASMPGKVTFTAEEERAMREAPGNDSR